MITGSAIDITHPKAVVFDLLTALLDSWSVWDATAGSEILGRQWRARYLELTYGCGAYRPYEELVAEAAADSGVLAGIILAIALNIWLIGRFEMVRLNPAYVIGSGIVMLLLGQIAVLLPAMRAAQVAPALAIRGPQSSWGHAVWLSQNAGFILK